jgi:hypothetical protein
MTKSALLVFILGCSSSTPATDAGTDAGNTNNDANAQDTGTTNDAPSGDSATCSPPQGTTCPTTAGNCKNIGHPCTKGGNQCPMPTACDLDLGPGVGICITIFTCTPDHGDCGNGATCCNTAMTSNTPVCLPNQCLPSDCTAEP